MKRSQSACALGALVLASAAMLFEVSGQDAAPKPPAPARKLNLGGDDRYLTHVATDKPIYRPGEKVYVRAAVLHANKRTPFGQAVQAMVEVTGPKGDTVMSAMTQIQDGVAGVAWDVPKTTAGGEYTVKVSHPWTGHVPGVRKFDVRAYRAPRLKSQIVFLRDGYGPGDAVSASVHVDRAEGGVPANAKVTAIARVDGVEVAKSETTIDEKGNASAKFNLPATIARGEGSLAFVIEDGGVLETASKTIPILLQTVDLSIYPEGGDLVAEVPNRVYLEAFTPAKKPADLAGVIQDSKGADVASFATAHEGRGRFSFTPKFGERYTLKINQPSGIKTTYPLPEVKGGPAAMAALDDVTASDKPVRLEVSTMNGGAFKVTLSQREKEVASTTVNLPTGAQPFLAKAPIELRPGDANGVLVATMWDEKGTPLAERLVFRRPAKTIKVDVRADQSTYVPGAPVKLTVTTTDDAGKPVSAVVGVTVTDDSVLEMIEKREQAPRLPVMVLVEPEVKELADAHVYLDPADPKAPLAMDLLLGTQGWRRFAFVKAEEFVVNHGESARRVLAMRAVTHIETQTAAGGIGGHVDFFRFAEGVPPAAAAAPLGAAVPADKLAEFAPAQLAKEKKDADGDRAQGVAGGALMGGRAFGLDAEPLRDQAGDELRKSLDVAAKREAAARRLVAGKPMASEPPMPLLVVREYAHAARPDRKANDRVDFAETLYWSAGVKTDPATGQATVSFATSDAVTSFRATADAFGGDGALGSGAGEVKSVQPFYAELKMPLEVTQGDRPEVPLALVNATTAELPDATFRLPQIPSFTDWAFGNKPSPLAAGGRRRSLVSFTVGDVAGEFDFTLNASAGAHADQVTRKLKVVPRGFPVEFARGGLVGPDGGVEYEIEIPKDLVASSVTSELNLYPTPLANLTQALEALIRSPSGCFEQTSSTTYPLTMAQQYFMSHQGVDPKLIERSREKLDEGYKRLISFECKKTKGYEWFGADPGHDALTAYGLLQFTDMALVREVDKTMLDNTRGFVLNSRDGNGGYKRQAHTLHTWVADPECANGYNTWALLETGTDPKLLAKEIAWIKENVSKSQNAYALALAANVCSFAADDRDAAKAFMDKLSAKQTKDGVVDGATTSVIGSGGEALQIETTALATLAWMRDPNYAGQVEKAMRWLCETCKGGRFGSTQSTILALRAIVTYDKLRSRPKAPGAIQVIVDGKPMGAPVAFDEKTQGAIKLADVAEMMSPGKHTIALRMENGANMPFSIAVKYNTVKPNSAEQCKVGITTVLRDKEVSEGSLTEAVATVVNKDKATVPTPIAIVGIPGGLEVRHDQLKELVKSNKIAAYEVIGREVVLYWRALEGGTTVEVPISLTAAIPGTYTGPASRAYLYYTDEHKQWADPLGVKIRARAE